ncbi:MAG: transporter, partial [Thermoanaerobaculia bacterium]
PTFVVLKQQSGWTYGMLGNHIFSFADAGGGASRPDLSITFLQPFLSFATKKATTFSLNTESTYDWKNEQWTVPINVSVSQLVRLGKLPVSFGIGGKYFAEKPASGPEWGLRFVVTLLFPK